LQDLSELERTRDAGYRADIVTLADAFTDSLIAGETAEITLPQREGESVEETGLKHRLAVAHAVEAQIVGKLAAAETVLRRAEARVRDAAVALLVAHGEEMAHMLELGEAKCRARRASLSALAGVWARGRPIQVGRQTSWVLTHGDYSHVEGVTGTRALLAHQSGHVLPPEPPPPDFQKTLAELLSDPEAPLE
jgi:hypothetical protein